MQRMVVSDELVEKLKRFPKTVFICDENGQTIRVFQLAEESEAREESLSEAEMVRTLNDVFKSN